MFCNIGLEHLIPLAIEGGKRGELFSVQLSIAIGVSSLVTFFILCQSIPVAELMIVVVNLIWVCREKHAQYAT